MTSIAILSTGQMGASFGPLFRSVLPEVGLLTSLSGRSGKSVSASSAPLPTHLTTPFLTLERTRSLAKSGGFSDRSLTELLKDADIILSVTIPSLAISLASDLVKAAESLSPNEIRTKTFIDLNAISPDSALEVEKVFNSSRSNLGGIKFIDGGIIGGPASLQKDYVPLIVLSGSYPSSTSTLLSQLFKNRTKQVGEEIGQASALKMSYASLTKGSTALAINTSVMASKYGVLDHLDEELGNSQPALQKVMRNYKNSVAKAFRWVGEMEEISASLSSAGMPDSGGKVFLGIAETYKEVAATELGKEKIEESLEKNRDWKEVVEVLAKAKETKSS